jgi:hypothetical protein
MVFSSASTSSPSDSSMSNPIDSSLSSTQPDFKLSLQTTFKSDDPATQQKLTSVFEEFRSMMNDVVPDSNGNINGDLIKQKLSALGSKIGHEPDDCPICKVAYTEFNSAIDEYNAIPVIELPPSFENNLDTCLKTFKSIELALSPNSDGQIDRTRINQGLGQLKTTLGIKSSKILNSAADIVNKDVEDSDDETEAIDPFDLTIKTEEPGDEVKAQIKGFALKDKPTNMLDGFDQLINKFTDLKASVDKINGSFDLTSFLEVKSTLEQKLKDSKLSATDKAKYLVEYNDLKIKLVAGFFKDDEINPTPKLNDILGSQMSKEMTEILNQVNSDNVDSSVGEIIAKLKTKLDDPDVKLEAELIAQLRPDSGINDQEREMLQLRYQVLQSDREKRQKEHANQISSIYRQVSNLASNLTSNLNAGSDATTTSSSNKSERTTKIDPTVIFSAGPEFED